MQLSRYLLQFPILENPNQVLCFSTKRGATALVPKDVLTAVAEGNDVGDHLEALLKVGVVVPDLAAEREEMRTALARSNERKDKFHAMTVLNFDCNLNCDYCYEAGFRKKEYMSHETAALFVQRMTQRIEQGQKVSVSFYGGEPLLSQGLIREISENLNRATRRHQGRDFGFSMTTNGTLLTRKVVEGLLPLGLKMARVTLDGPPDIHNRQRPFASGAESFEVIANNIWEACEKIKIQLGGNYRKENYRRFPELLDHLLDRGVTPEKLESVQFGPITAKAGIPDFGGDCTSSGEPWLVDATLFLREEIMRRGFKTQKAGPSACMVEFEHNLVVNWDGTLYKCPALMGWEGTSIGTLSDGISDYSASHALGAWQNEQCLDCVYLPMCFGGCRFLNLLSDKTMADLDCRREFYEAGLERLVRQELAMRRGAATSPA